MVDPDGTIMGIVPSQDLAAGLKGSAPISGVMICEVHAIPQYNDVHHAARLMRNHRLHHVQQVAMTLGQTTLLFVRARLTASRIFAKLI